MIEEEKIKGVYRNLIMVYKNNMKCLKPMLIRKGEGNTSLKLLIQNGILLAEIQQLSKMITMDNDDIVIGVVDLQALKEEFEILKNERIDMKHY